MLIACVQSDVTFADPQSNLDRVLQWMERASQLPAGPAELVVFPECMLTGYTFDSRRDAAAVALSIDDPLLQKIVDSAHRLNQLVSVGFIEKDGEKLYNAATLIGPEGVLQTYRKIHLPHLGVDRFVDRGNLPYQVCVAKSSRSGPVKIGLAICYDASFPEPIRVLGLSGADIVALGTNWPDEATTAAAVVPRARSMENHLYFVAANRVGQENGFGFCGNSSICGPDGLILNSSSDANETLLVADADLEIARNKRIERTKDRHSIDRFKDRRPEFYGKIAQDIGGLDG